MKRNIFVVVVGLVLVLLLAGCTPKPVINVNLGDDIIPLNGDFNNQGCTITISSEDHLMTRTANPVNNEVVGQYILVYEYTHNETVYTCERMVFVVDDIAPIVTLNAGIDTITVGTEWIDSSVTSIDNYDTELTLDISGEVDYNSIGRYMITYTVTDMSENVAEIVRYVTVIE